MKLTIRHLHQNGWSGYRIAKYLGCCRSTVYYHINPAYKHRKDQRGYERGRELKSKLVMAHGGRCIKCGYNKCLSALEFHHRDKDKEFYVTQAGRNFESALKESRKCDLLCANCHREQHDESGD